MITYPVVSPMDVFHRGLVFRVLRDLDSRLVVTKEGRRVRYIITELLEEVTHPHYLTAHLRSHSVLRFGAGQRGMWLKATPPLDSTPAPPIHTSFVEKVEKRMNSNVWEYVAYSPSERNIHRL